MAWFKIKENATRVSFPFMTKEGYSCAVYSNVISMAVYSSLLEFSVGQHIRMNKRRPRHSVHFTLPHFHLLLTEYCVRVVVWFQITALCRRTQSLSHHVGTAKLNARYVVQTQRSKTWYACYESA